MFAYCLNNPGNLVDHTGNIPGDIFYTELDAVRDAATHIGALSFENGWEYSTTIYTVKETYQVVEYVIRYVSPDGRRPIRLVGKRIVSYTVTKYTYTYVHTDENAKSVLTHYAPEGHDRVCIIHTHPLGSGLGITQFSDDDIRNALRKYKCPLYVYSPDGVLLKFDPFTYTTISVFEDLPKSVKQP